MLDNKLAVIGNVIGIANQIIANVSIKREEYVTALKKKLEKKD